jgi:hypothetical protein
MRQQQMITNDNIHDALVRFILNCVMFHSSCLSFCSFSFGIFLSFILRLMVSLFKNNLNRWHRLNQTWQEWFSIIWFAMNLNSNMILIGWHVKTNFKITWHEMVVGSNSSYKPITNTAWVRAPICKLQKRVHSIRSRKW